LKASFSQDGLCPMDGTEVGQVCACLRGRGEHLFASAHWHSCLPGTGLPNNVQVYRYCARYNTVMYRHIIFIFAAGGNGVGSCSRYHLHGESVWNFLPKDTGTRCTVQTVLLIITIIVINFINRNLNQKAAEYITEIDKDDKLTVPSNWSTEIGISLYLLDTGTWSRGI